MIGCAKGLLLCQISKNEQLEIVRPEVEYSNRYIVELVHCGNALLWFVLALITLSQARFPQERQTTRL
jgi:hypothetical protein